MEQSKGYLTYEEFEQRFAIIVNFMQEREKRGILLRDLYPEGYVVDTYGDKLLDEYISLLSSNVGDLCEWISYYVWETDLGKKEFAVSINDIKIPFTTVKDLYDAITHI